jgi:hypothetical protein
VVGALVGAEAEGPTLAPRDQAAYLHRRHPNIHVTHTLLEDVLGQDLRTRAEAPRPTGNRLVWAHSAGGTAGHLVQLAPADRRTVGPREPGRRVHTHTHTHTLMHAHTMTERLDGLGVAAGGSWTPLLPLGERAVSLHVAGARDDTRVAVQLARRVLVLAGTADAVRDPVALVPAHDDVAAVALSPFIHTEAVVVGSTGRLHDGDLASGYASAYSLPFHPMHSGN